MDILFGLAALAAVAAYLLHRRAARRHADAWAAIYGLRRMPGESNRELRRRVAARSMIRRAR